MIMPSFWINVTEVHWAHMLSDTRMVIHRCTHHFSLQAKFNQLPWNNFLFQKLKVSVDAQHLQNGLTTMIAPSLLSKTASGKSSNLSNEIKINSIAASIKFHFKVSVSPQIIHHQVVAEMLDSKQLSNVSYQAAMSKL
jgi:hypothetical protein